MSRDSYTTSQIRYKIILVGDAGAGKTSILWRYIKNEEPRDQIVTTIDFRSKDIVIQDRKVKLCIWDTAGQEKFRSIVGTYFKSCQGVVLVFDMSIPKSWESIKNVWYEMAIKRAPTACFILLGAKKDLEVAVDLSDINQWCAQKGIYFIQTSAKTGEHVQQAFFTFAALIDCCKYSETSMMSSFATSYRSTEHTKGLDGVERGQSRGSKEQPFNTMSFYLKKSPDRSYQSKCCN